MNYIIIKVEGFEKAEKQLLEKSTWLSTLAKMCIAIAC